MDGKHTPGPWHFDDGGDGDLEIWSAAYHPTMPLCSVGNYGPAGPSSTDNANARVIAAAPELLEACERVLKESVRVEYDEDGPACAEMAYEVLEVVRAAIAKAEGGAA